ncbi:hypothetical protein pb186bvf_017772 [Paramecium bursaria]
MNSPHTGDEINIIQKVILQMRTYIIKNISFIYYNAIFEL